MILEKIAPIIVFHIPKTDTNPIPTPVPIYLHPTLTGIWITGVTKGMTAVTEQVTKDSVAGGKRETIIKQQPNDKNLTVKLQGVRSNFGLSVFLAATDIIMDIIAKKKDYYVSFFFQNILIYHGKISSLTISNDDTNNLTNIDIAITVKTDDSTQDEASGTVPVPEIPISLEDMV